jgi:hypothetical protein
MSTPNDPAAALAEAVRAYLKTYTGDYNIAEESKLGTALADYEAAAKAVPAKPVVLDPLRVALESIANSCSIEGDPEDAADTLQWIEKQARDALSRKCQYCENGIIRSLGRDNDEIIEDCPHCTEPADSSTP